jgi:hypothetical protein
MAVSEEICLWEVDGGDCGDTATESVRVRDRTGVARIPVCPKHKAEHHRKAARLRADSKR